jgi:hypothetical protein
MDPKFYTTDTSPDALAVQLECLRKMSPSERIRRTCAMSRRIRQMGMDAIRRRHPELSDDERQLLFIELTYGKTLADDLRRWKVEQTR